MFLILFSCVKFGAFTRFSLKKTKKKQTHFVFVKEINPLSVKSLESSDDVAKKNELSLGFHVLFHSKGWGWGEGEGVGEKRNKNLTNNLEIPQSF